MYDRNRFGFGFRPNFGHFGWISVLPKLQNPFRFRYRPKQKKYFGFGYLPNSAQILSDKATLRAIFIPQNLFVSIWCYFWSLGRQYLQEILNKKLPSLPEIVIFSRIFISVSAEIEIFFRFRYRFRPKRKMPISASFGFGRNEKKPFGRTLRPTHLFEEPRGTRD